jgi:hypothetical protein
MLHSSRSILWSFVTSSVRRAIAVLVIVSMATLGALGYRWAVAVTADPRPSVLDVRLGMTADEIRQRIDAQGPGTWTTELVNGDWVLTHEDAGGVATFEIHEGQLVAIRLDARARMDLREGPEFEVTPGSVLVRTLA